MIKANIMYIEMWQDSIDGRWHHIQLHAWGDDLKEAFEQVTMAMFGYMTEIDYVEMKEMESIEAEGHDMLSLLFHLLDEWLFQNKS